MLQYGRNLYERAEKPVFVTRGSRGIVVIDRNGDHTVPGIQLLGKLDPVGAGDTSTSALALSLAAGASPPEAAYFANFASAVTVKKLFCTGTANAREILEMAGNPDFIHQPELANDPR